MRLTLPCYLALLCLLAALRAASCIAATQEPPVAPLAVNPGSVELRRFDGNGTVRINVFARLTGATGLPSDAVLTATAAPGVDVKVGVRSKVPGDVVWPVMLSVSSDAPDKSKVDFRLAYMPPAGQAAAAGRPTLVIQRASLDVNVVPTRMASPGEHAEASIVPDTINVNESVPGRAFLLVSNKSNFAFFVSSIQFDQPKFLVVTPERKSAEVPAQGAMKIRLQISIRKDHTPQTGDWPVLASVTLSRGTGALERKSIVVAQRNVHVGVQGVSAVLTALGLPSLLLIPGALIVATWALMFEAVEATKFTWLEWKSPSFWLVAITLSIVIFGAQIWFGFGPNFLVAYGLGDVAALWLICIGLGVVSWLLYFGGKQAWIAHQERQARRIVPPLEILQQLVNENKPVYMPAHPYPPDGKNPQTIFRTSLESPDDKQAWVVPRMKCRRTVDKLEARELLREIFVANDNAANRPAALVELLAEGVEKRRLISLEWEKGRIDRKKLLPIDALGKPGPMQSPLHFG